jgi:hypothetical protein
MTTPSSEAAAWSAAPPSSFTAATWLRRPGTSSLPSAGQSNTCRKRVPGFCVQRPQGSLLNGVAEVP